MTDDSNSNPLPNSASARPTPAGPIVVLGILTAVLSTGFFVMWRQQQTVLRELRQEIGSLRATQGAIQVQIASLEANGCSVPGKNGQPKKRNAPTRITTGNDPFQGSPNAKVVLIEFSDYQCPYCGKFAREIMPQIERNYIETGKVRYVFRDFPLEAIHPNAFKAAEAARCAAEQGRYWEMHRSLFQKQDKLNAEGLLEQAASLNIDRGAFANCLDSGKYAQGIRADMTDGREAAISGTPSFFIATPDPQKPDSTDLIVQKILKYASYEDFSKALDEVIGAKHAAGKATKK